ncbi:MAG TPA: chorismate pyruvate-lyase family protein [Nitrososphaeraceae archaeon]
MMHRVYNVKNHQLLTINDISKLEAISHKKFDLAQRILLIDLGNTQHLLEVINNTATKIRVIEQVEEKNIIKRKSCIISSTNNILAYANSKIYCKIMPLQVLDEIRQRREGIGKILLYHRMEIFKKITEIGYDTGLHIFKNYSLYHKEHLICRINEIFPMKLNKTIS